MQNTLVKATSVSYLDAYMDEFYGSLTTENEEIGRFLSEVAFPQVDKVKVLDVACGPSAFYWTLFHKGIGELHGLDARMDSIDYLRQIADACARGDIDPRYLEVARWHGLADGEATDFVRQAAGRVKTLHEHDIASRWPYEDGMFHGVVSCFGIDHVETPDEFAFALAEANRVLATDGVITLATLCETNSWRCGQTYAACLFTTKNSLHDNLVKAGFRPTMLEERSATTALENDQGYEKMLFCRAVKV